MLIDSLVKIVPAALDRDVSLVDTPRAADGSREPTPTLLELGRVANNPAHDGGVRNHNGAFRHHRFDFVNFSFLGGASPQARQDALWLIPGRAYVPGITLRATVLAQTRVCGSAEPGEQVGPRSLLRGRFDWHCRYAFR